MKRVRLIVVGVVCTVAVADAQSLSVKSKPARAHAKVTPVASSALRSGGLDGINFSNPYPSPVGTGKTANTPFPAVLTHDPGPLWSFRLLGGYPSSFGDEVEEPEVLP